MKIEFFLTAIILLTGCNDIVKTHQEPDKNQLAREIKAEEDSKKNAEIYDAKYKKSILEYEAKKEQDNQIQNRINAYKDIKKPTKEQQMQQLIDIQQMQLKLQADNAKQSEIDKKNAEFDKAINGIKNFTKELDRKQELDNALRKDHLNRALGTY